MTEICFPVGIAQPCFGQGRTRLAEPVGQADTVEQPKAVMRQANTCADFAELAGLLIDRYVNALTA